jgi:hypothetical protein
MDMKPSPSDQNEKRNRSKDGTDNIKPDVASRWSDID